MDSLKKSSLLVSVVHVLPPFTEVDTYPPSATATSVEPLLDEGWLPAPEVRLQATPPLDEV
jgi:hypothetical protein